ncbi:serine hydrolase domain-containing protein [Phenylobacterium sp.]|uniref:serine hydrolase n=1 Tax=Phenylobacterium sp. TaxID=1871053 RepID=UPI00272EE8E8|nr:serine hydrolase domain-containing protein [Phenylobacterium sp.]MDP2215311.1 serine hydrolase domain-containing protein [Phenylobacterium sp.]
MSLSRRALLSAAVLAAPAPAFAQWPFGLGRRGGRAPRAGRADYAGPPLRQQLGDWQFDQIRTAVSARLQPVIRDAIEDRFIQGVTATPGVEAATAALAEPGGAVWTQSWTRDGTAPAAQFAWDGLDRAYVATAAAQMVEGGALTLDAEIARWAPDLPNAAWITLEDLLAHTSGLPDLTAPEPQVALFQPGAAMRLSPANDALLAQVLTAAADAPMSDLLAQRIATRRDLGETIFTAGEPVAVNASALDVVRFWRDLLGDRLHGGEMTRRRFYRLHPVGEELADYVGLGVRVRDLAADAGAPADTWLYAGEPNAASIVAYSMTTRATVAVTLKGSGAADALARSLLDVVAA